MTRVAVVSGGKSALTTWSGDIDFDLVIAINAGLEIVKSHADVFAARDACMLRQYALSNTMFGMEVWTRPEYFDLAKNLYHNDLCTDISPETVGYGYTATATLFVLFCHFKFCESVHLFGFDMVDSAAVSKLSSTGAQRWDQEIKEFKDICRAMTDYGITVKDVRP